MAVSGIVTDSDIGNVRGPSEFLNALDRRNLVRNVLDHDSHAGKFADLGDRRIGIIKGNGAESVPGITEMHHYIGWRYTLGELERALDLVQGKFSMPALRIKWRYPDFLFRSNIFEKRQMNRWRRKGVFLEPASNGAQKPGIVEIQMRTVAEKLESFVTGFPYGFQQIHGDRLPAVNLCRDSKLHERIVQDGSPLHLFH